MKQAMMLSAGLLLSGASALLGQQYFVSTIAGGAPIPTPIAAVNAPLSSVAAATDAAGNVYFTSDRCVFKMDAQGS